MSYQCVSMWDVDRRLGDEVLRDAWLLIEDRVVQSVENTVPEGVESITDLGTLTVLPGFIDCHDHLSITLGDEEEQAREPVRPFRTWPFEVLP